MKGGYVYIMSNKMNGVLYVGVAADLAARVYQHRNNEGSQFCRRFGLKRLVFAEHFDLIEDAIAAEKRIKKWRRKWKIDLIEKHNPNWDDLFQTINQ